MMAPATRSGRPIGWQAARLLIEAGLALATARAAIRLRPFKHIVSGALRPAGLSARPAELAQLRWAVEAMARRDPWRALCFERALALRALLNRRGIASVLHYGIANDGDEALTAHVWLSVAGEVVIGGEAVPRVARVASFPPEPSL